jgi:single-stranded DNA-binding protein
MSATFQLAGTVIGNPVSAESKAGKTYVTLEIECRKQVNGKEDATMHRVVLFGWDCDKASSCKSGDVVFVSGDVVSKQREHNGKTYYDTSLFGSGLQIVRRTPNKGAESETTSFDDDDLPF